MIQALLLRLDFYSKHTVETKEEATICPSQECLCIFVPLKLNAMPAYFITVEWKGISCW